MSEHPPGTEEEPEGSGLAAAVAEEDGGDEAGGNGEESVVYYFLEESTGYMQPALQGLALAHTLVAFLCIIGYNCLKVRPATPGHAPPLATPPQPRPTLVPPAQPYLASVSGHASPPLATPACP